MLRLLASLFLVSVFGLCGCGTIVTTPENTAWAGLSAYLTGSHSDPTSTATLNPGGWYMKVQLADTPPALVAFGYLEMHTTPPTEVWFSGSGQVIKLRAGRIVATSGLPNVNWKNVAMVSEIPEWSAVGAQQATYKRTRSTLPNYDFGIQEWVRIGTASPPRTPVASLIPGANNEKAIHWRWYSETTANSPRKALPDAVYATAHIRGATVVAYTEQCLSEDFCLKLMRWPQLESEPHPW